MRLGKALIVIGVVLIAASFSRLTTYEGFGGNVAHGDYEGIIVKNAGCFGLEVHLTDGHPFNLYVLGFEEAISVVKGGNISGVSSLYKWENITGFSGSISVMEPGWYAVLLSPFWNETVGYEVTVSGAIPNPSIILTGVIACAAGVVTIVLNRMLHARKKAELESPGCRVLH